MFNIKNAVLEAEIRIRPYVRKTHLELSKALSKKLNNQIFLKHENTQFTGSFKARGAINKLLSLTAEQSGRGIVTASSGNHGAAIAYGLNKLNMQGVIFVPENVSPAKAENIRNYYDSLKFYATDCMHTELYAREYAEKQHMIYISPYNDEQVIAGQGTIATELLQEIQKIDAIFVPIGGGGLISGIAGYLKAVSPHTKIIGCLPQNSPVMAESIKCGHIIAMETQETLADATAGGIEPNAITFALCQKYVDSYCLVSEEEIKNALITAIQTQHTLIEGAAAVALAGFLQKSKEFNQKNIVILLSGANISMTILRNVLR